MIITNDLLKIYSNIITLEFFHQLTISFKTLINNFLSTKQLIGIPGNETFMRVSSCREFIPAEYR